MASPPGEAATRKAGKGWRWFKSFQYDKERDSPNDARNVLLIVAALIAAVTFQAGVNPPGGVWQETNSTKGHFAGEAIYATEPEAFYVFLTFNTLALSSSILVIASLTHSFPLFFEIWLSILSMIITYGSAIFAVTPKTVKFRFILFMAAVPYVLRILWEVYIRIYHFFSGN